MEYSKIGPVNAEYYIIEKDPRWKRVLKMGGYFFCAFILPLIVISFIIEIEKEPIAAAGIIFTLGAIVCMFFYEQGRRAGWNDKDRWEIEDRNRKDLQSAMGKGEKLK